jgi:putative tryptophan/tyrosine transport system substrate-binding protein
VKRRRFTQVVGGWVITCPPAVWAQRPALPVIGYLSGVSRNESEDRLAAFLRGLNQSGYVEGSNVAIEYRWAGGDYDRLPAMAAELVRKPVTLLVATGGPRAVLAAKAATSTIPIAFTIGADPVMLGVVQTLSRPGGNATGVSFLAAELMPKRFELLRELVPASRRVALVVNPNTPTAEEQVRRAEAAARASGTRLQVERVGTEAEIDAAFAAFGRSRPDALLIGTDAFFNRQSRQFIALCARHALPANYEGRNAVVAGGLMSYGPDIAETFVQTGHYAGRLLAGAKPAELPVLQPTTFQLAINRSTAKTLGLAIPQALLLRADEVIE